MCVFFAICESQKSVDVCCRSLYCITLYMFVQGNNLKMTQISIFAHIYRDGMRGGNVTQGDDPRARRGLREDKGSSAPP